MTDRELKKLKRQDLLEILIFQNKEISRLKEQLEQAEEELHTRRIAIDKAGSIAEAALQLNGVFEAAQAAAEQYLDNIRQMSGVQESLPEATEQETQEQPLQISAADMPHSPLIEDEGGLICAEKDREAHWENLLERVQKYGETCPEVKELLQEWEQEGCEQHEG